MKHSNEYDAFTELVDQVLAVPHSVIQERVEEARRRAEENPRKRGPKKRKAKPSASSRASSSRKRQAA